jgi:hypothetical protein
MRKQIKISLLWIAKVLGLFALCRWSYRHKVRILCYHGFSYADEHIFRPKLFMTPQTFSSRMKFLAKSPYKIVSLQEAIENSEPHQLVITIDDGWSGTYQLIHSALETYRFPIMLYVTSYYAEKQIPVINVSLSYLLWKTQKKELHLSIPELSFEQSWQLDCINPPVFVIELCAVIDQIQDVDRRKSILIELSKQLEVSLTHDGIQLFRLLNISELTQLQAFNVDIQLHTHRHCSPKDEHQLLKELADNKLWLSQIQAPEKLKHFCFPSNEYHPEQISHLSKFGVKTAVTSNSGFYSRGDNLYLIPRILDGEDVSQIELEAELCGFMTIVKSFYQIQMNKQQA